jgi:hypothetical protein
MAPGPPVQDHLRGRFFVSPDTTFDLYQKVKAQSRARVKFRRITGGAL